MSSQSSIQVAISEYSPKIESHRPAPNSLSQYRVEKPWGWELWMDLNEFYAYKMIHMTAGHQCSLQSHEFKFEANFVIKGKAEVLLEEDGQMKSYVFEAGSGWTVKPGQKHRVIAVTDYTALEVSSPHLNDVIRYQDDSGRGSGKIDSEHEL